MIRVAVGGTFEFLHPGHRKVLARACEIAKAGEVAIGITSNRFASLKSHHVADFDVRCRQVLNFVSGFDVNATIVQLNDAFGPALNDCFDYIVVSPETFSVAVELNKKRKERFLPEIEIICVDYVLAQDGKPISSSRIANGEIDVNGMPLHTPYAENNS